MLSPRWRKVLRDLWGNRARTLLVVLAIAVGVFAVGVITSSHIQLSRDLQVAWQQINPASAVLFTEPFEDELLWTIRRLDGVAAAEGRRNVQVRVRVGPDQWRNLILTAIPDYEAMRIEVIRPQEGAWPPPDQQVLIERASRSFIGANIGEQLFIDPPSSKRRWMPVAGFVHDMNVPAPIFTGQAFGYITMDTLEWLGEPRSYNELRIVVSGDAFDKDHIRRVAEEVRDRIERSGREVFYIWIPEPGRHWAKELLDAMTFLQLAMGLLALGLSGFLVVNTLSAVLAQQVRQIGVMKAIGARPSQLTGMYLGMVSVYGLLALIPAVPLGVVGAKAYTAFGASLVNIDIGDYRLPPVVLALQVAVGLAVPVLAALYPVWAGTRVTVREAIHDYGLGHAPARPSLIDRWLERWRGLSRPALLSLRNTFRRKGRLALTLITLSLAGAIFVGVFSVRASLLRTLDDALRYWDYDLSVDFSRSYRSDYVRHQVLSVPGVVAAESWGVASVRRLRADGTESETIFLVAPPAGSQLLNPMLEAGRWLLPEDENAVVINTDVLRTEPDLAVGDELILKIDGRETTWRIVGIARSALTGPTVYVNYPHYAYVARDLGRAGGVRVVTAQHDAAFQEQVARELERRLEEAGMHVSRIETTGQIRQRATEQFNILVAFLMVMALLLALVGALGLAGTMSINVLERMREIGVMRAIGASDGAVRQVFILEGVVIGALSWAIGTVLAVPISRILSDTVGLLFLKAPLSYRFSAGGALFWLVAVLALAALASLVPAWNASRLRVREILAYE